MSKIDEVKNKAAVLGAVVAGVGFIIFFSAEISALSKGDPVDKTLENAGIFTVVGGALLMVPFFLVRCAQKCPAYFQRNLQALQAVWPGNPPIAPGNPPVAPGNPQVGPGNPPVVGAVPQAVGPVLDRDSPAGGNGAGGHRDSTPGTNLSTGSQLAVDNRVVFESCV